MEVLFKQSGAKGSFYIEQEGKVLAEMTFSMAGKEKMIIDHTEVDGQLRGLGAGLQMVTAAVNHARVNSLRILPLCPFARSVFQKKPEFKDVWL